jgi:CO dehydrogenase/acetyl-CoA synthase alpha subunit
MSKLPAFIMVKGHKYRLASKKTVTPDEVKESISRAADKAAIENIISNLVVHAGHIQEAAPQMLEMLDGPKSKADKSVENLKAHCDVIQEFLGQLMPTYNRYTSKHVPKKRKPKEEESAEE